MILKRYGDDEAGVLVVEPDDPEELVAVDSDDAEAIEPRARIYNVDGAYWDNGRGVWVRPVANQELD